MQASLGVRVHKLKLRGQSERQHSVISSLQRAAWPQAESEAYLLIRKLKIRGSSSEIGAKAAFAAQQLAQTAVDGWSAEADQALAVRFANRCDLLACLLRDRLAGQTQHRWFWREWLHYWDLSTSSAVAQLLMEAAHNLPSLLGKLENSSTARILWQSLDAAGALALLTQIQRYTAWNILETSAAPEFQPSPPCAVPAIGKLRWPQGLPQLTADDPRILLVCLLHIWQNAPQLLTDPNATSILKTTANALEQIHPFNSAATTLQSNARSAPEVQVLNDEVGNEASPSPETKLTQPNPLEEAGLPSADHRELTDHVLNFPNTTQTATIIQQPDQAPSKSIQPTPAELAESQRWAEPSFSPQQGESGGSDTPSANGQPIQPNGLSILETPLITLSGGHFFLINLLNLKPVQALLKEEPAVDYAAGWVWIYQLGKHLGLECDAVLQRFLANQAGLTLNQLETLTTSKNMNSITSLALERYGSALSQVDLFKLPAWIISNPSHLDIHFRMDDARLEFRTVGLDINPGWVAWLGRVVSFHYGYPLPLQGFAE